MTMRTNDEYNTWLAGHSDVDEDADRDYELFGTGKRLAYIGWFWRAVDVVGRDIPLGWADGGFVGIMARNKWDYRQRDMTPDEAEHFVAAIEAAMDAEAAGAAREDINRRLRDVSLWIQGLRWYEEP